MGPGAEQPAQRLPASGPGHRTGTIDVTIPKLREGSFFPDWLLTRRRRAEAALTSVVATCYLLGCRPAGWTNWSKHWASPGRPARRCRKWPKTSTGRWRGSGPRPLAAGSYTFLAADALSMKVREGGRVVKIAVMVATGVNA